MVYEMEKNRFPNALDDTNLYLHPVNLSHISHLVEVNQLGFGEKELWIHTDPISRNTSEIDTQVGACPRDRLLARKTKKGLSSQVGHQGDQGYKKDLKLSCTKISLRPPHSWQQTKFIRDICIILGRK